MSCYEKRKLRSVVGILIRVDVVKKNCDVYMFYCFKVYFYLEFLVRLFVILEFESMVYTGFYKNFGKMYEYLE